MKTTPQAGITNRPPDHLAIAAYDVGGTGDAARATLQALQKLVHSELRSILDDTTPASPKDQPSAETGELGFTSHYDRYHLTITVGLASTAFDKLGTEPTDRPGDLKPIPWGQLGDTPTATAENGDIVLQVCSDSIYINEHVLRRIGEELGDQLTPVWTLAGQQRHTSRSGRVNREEGRALIGFKDGTSNLNPRNNPEDARLVFVEPTDVAGYPPLPTTDPTQPSPYGGPVPPTFPTDLAPPPAAEPDWCRKGTYLTVRGSTFDAAAWDKRSLGDQERTIGRFKVSGQPLSSGTDDPHAPPVDPDYTNDPGGSITPLQSHIRKSNPRGPGDDQRRIYRRGYSLITAPGAGGLTRGLVFIAFGRTISTQFEFITRAWTLNENFPVPGSSGKDPLRDIETVLCGGYFFVPPLTKASQPWSFALPPAGATPIA